MFQLSDIFYFTLQSYSAPSPEITGLKLELKIFLSALSCCIRIWNNKSGSRQKFRLQPDPDPGHCFYEYRFE